MLIDPQAVSSAEMYRFLISAVVPRPIAWVSTRAADGSTNLAPFSYFIALSSEPPLIGIAINDREGDPKDTLRNIRETGEWVVNVVSEALLPAMSRTAADWPHATSEFAVSGVTEAPSARVGAPHVLESPLRLECRLHREIALGKSFFVVGEVVMGFVDDDVLTEGRVDAAKLAPVGRLGGEYYAPLREVAKVPRPRVSRTTGEVIG